MGFLADTSLFSGTLHMQLEVLFVQKQGFSGRAANVKAKICQWSWVYEQPAKLREFQLPPPHSPCSFSVCFHASGAQ